MKKVFFAFVVTSMVVLTACNNKPAESTETKTADTASVSTMVKETAPADTSKAAMTDSSATTTTTTTTTK